MSSAHRRKTGPLVTNILRNEIALSPAGGLSGSSGIFRKGVRRICDATHTQSSLFENSDEVCSEIRMAVSPRQSSEINFERKNNRTFRDANHTYLKFVRPRENQSCDATHRTRVRKMRMVRRLAIATIDTLECLLISNMGCHPPAEVWPVERKLSESHSGKGPLRFESPVARHCFHRVGVSPYPHLKRGI